MAASKTKKMKLKSKSKISAKNKSSAKAKANKPAVKAKTKIKTKTSSPAKNKSIAKGKTSTSTNKGPQAKKALVTAKSVVKKSSAKKSATLAKAKSAAKVPMASKAVALAQFQPLDDRLLVQIASKEKRTAGGLYIPDTASVSGNFQAIVVAVGVGHKNKKGKIRPMDVRVGDTVLINEYAGDKVEFESKEYRILRETDVLGIQEK